MPRIENGGDNVTAWCEESGEGSSTFDVCKSCFKKVEGKPPTVDLQPYNGDPVGDTVEWCDDGWMYNDDVYDCQICGTRLNATRDI